MYIDSPGGVIQESLSIISTMNGIKCPVATFCYGTAGGAAAIIAAHGARGFRTAATGSTFSFKFSEGAGRDRMRAEVQPFQQFLAEILAKDTHKPIAMTLKWLREGAEFAAQQALMSGLVDIVGNEPVKPPG
jgi:ATP-dependent Clp protease protease subunit